MIRQLMRLVMIPMILSTASLASYAAAEKFTIDDKHSYVQWHINHLGFSNQSGKWFVTGSVILDKEKPELSKVDISIDMASIITGLPALDNHLKEPLFFDVAKYPKATFVSDKVDVLTKNSAKVHGTLTLRGVSKPVTLMVTLNKEGKNPISDKFSVGFNATTQLKRSDFGMTALLPNLGDTVDIQIGAEAYQEKS